MSQLITTLGPLDATGLGMILPHEHIFVDLRTDNPPDFAQADVDDVIRLVKPGLDKAREVGITALVECSTVGVGRRADILKAVSEAAKFPIVVPTGIYREPWIPKWAHDASEDHLYNWMLGELRNNIDGTDVRAGWIKLSAGDEGLTPCETKILRAAARAGAETNAVIGSHTVLGRVMLEQLKIIEEVGYTPGRFIWIHAQAEPEFEFNLEVAKRGAWIEYDWIGGQDMLDDHFYVERIQGLFDAGYGEQILLSHDRGWYDPALPGGGTPQPLTYITQQFIPNLKSAGFDDDAIKMLTQDNPFRAFSR